MIVAVLDARRRCRRDALDGRRAPLRRRRREPARRYAAGIRVRDYQVATYVLASLSYGAAGILVAGFLGTPEIGAGNDYLLPTIAAVVLGGTSLAGGRGSVVATAVGALFLTQLEQVVLGMGAPSSVQLVIQGSIIALGMALRYLPDGRASRLAASSLAARGQPRQPATRFRGVTMRPVTRPFVRRR